MGQVADQLAKDILALAVPAPATQGNTTDRLVRILDEERIMRMRAENEMVNLGERVDEVRDELNFQTNRVQELMDRNREQSRTIQDLNAEISRMNWELRTEEVERLRTTLIRLANEARDDFERPVVNPIPTIKQVRERFGLNLKDAKDVVDQWRFLDAEEAEALDREVGLQS